MGPCAYSTASNSACWSPANILTDWSEFTYLHLVLTATPHAQLLALLLNAPQIGQRSQMPTWCLGLASLRASRVWACQRAGVCSSWQVKGKKSKASKLQLHASGKVP
eukprot:1156272-Pelagomonas_calceolata.AAC.13